MGSVLDYTHQPVNSTMELVLLILLTLQVTQGYNLQNRGRALEVEVEGNEIEKGLSLFDIFNEGSGMDEDSIVQGIMEVDDEENEDYKSIFETLYGFGTKFNKILFDQSSPVQYALNYDYSEVIESLKNIAEFLTSEDSPGQYFAHFDYQSLLERITPTFYTAVPRSLIGDFSDLPTDYLREGVNHVSEVGVIESAKQFGLMVKEQAKSLISELSTTSIFLYTVGVGLLGGLLAISAPVTAILGSIFLALSGIISRGSRNLFNRIRERDDYLFDGIRTARSLLGAQGFDEDVLDRMAAGVMKAVDTYSMLQGLQGDNLFDTS